MSLEQNDFPNLLKNKCLEGVIVLNSKGAVKIVNPIVEKLSGYNKLDIVGKHFSLLPFIHSNPHFSSEFQKALNGETIHSFLVLNNLPKFKILRVKVKYIPIPSLSDATEEVLIQLLEASNPDEVVEIETKRKENAGIDPKQLRTLEEPKTRISGQKLYDLIRNFPGFAFKCKNDKDWSLSFISSGCQNVTGYGQNDFLSKMVTFDQLIVPENRKYVWDTIQNAIENRETYNLEYRIETADGEEKWLWEQGRAYYDETDDEIILEGLAVDISKRKKAEISLAYSEERFRVLFEKSPVAKGISRKGTTIQVNKAYLELFGYSRPEELIGKSILEQISPPERPLIIEKIKARERGEFVQNSYETVGIRKDGSKFPFHIDVGYFELPDGMATIAYIKDITQEKKNKKDLEESISKFHALFESEIMGIGISQEDGKVLEANDTFLKMLGYSRKDFEEGEINWINLTPPEYHEMDLNGLEEMRKYGIMKPFEKEYITKDGGRRPVVIGASLLGKEKIGLTYVIDMTELKQSRNDLLTINKELNTFLYMASHDLKGPLASIIGLTEIARAESKDPVAQKYIDYISQCTTKLDRSLMNLLKIMKIKGDSDKKEFIDFEQTVEDIIENLQKIEGFSNVKFVKKIDIKHKYSTNVGILNSVVQNLIENGIKYQSHVNGRPYVEIRINEGDNHLVIEVEDNGKGIDPSIKSKVFDMFYRGTTDSKGSGLGLYIVKNAVEKIGGKIDFRPGKESGTIFTLLLPK